MSKERAFAHSTWMVNEHWASQRNLRTPEVAAARKLFNDLDQDHSGSIDAQELEVAMRRLGQHPTQEQIADLIASVEDGDPDGQIQMREFFKLYQRGLDTKGAPVREMSSNIFLSMGKDPHDKSATVSTAEIRSKILSEYGLDVDFHEVFGISAVGAELDRKAFEELILTPRQ